MITITNYTVEKLEDPFGILTGDRYEFFLHIEVSEDDELYSEKGLTIKVLYIVDQDNTRMSHYHIIEKGAEKVLDFELEDDEVKTIQEFCISHIPAK